MAQDASGIGMVTAAFVSIAGTSLCWAMSTDTGAVVTQIVSISAAIGGAIWVVGQGGLRLYSDYLARRLTADVQRDREFGSTISAQLMVVTDKLEVAETIANAATEARDAMRVQLEDLLFKSDSTIQLSKKIRQEAADATNNVKIDRVDMREPESVPPAPIVDELTADRVTKIKMAVSDPVKPEPKPEFKRGPLP